ncbi:hypothetical protein CEXT_676481 [Caerostris extrusa]|uniref:Uncharacterized protein n=1 Tax=Caerostris extrusa TaxID=172846 RepID=A0AAV4Y2C9_CAEEX|nr:hypothetical protein CEXT_676481 [Caerostris extrusa]
MGFTSQVLTDQSFGAGEKIYDEVFVLFVLLALFLQPNHESWDTIVTCPHTSENKIRKSRCSFLPTNEPDGKFEIKKKSFHLLTITASLRNLVVLTVLKVSVKECARRDLPTLALCLIDSQWSFAVK